MINNSFNSGSSDSNRTGRKKGGKKCSPLTIAITVITLVIGAATSFFEDSGSCTFQKNRGNDLSSGSSYDFDFDFDADIPHINSEEYFPKLRITQATLYKETNTLSVVMENYGVYAQTYIPYITIQTGRSQNEGFITSAKPSDYYSGKAAELNSGVITYRTIIPPKSEITFNCNIEEYQTERCIEAASLLDTGVIFATISIGTAEESYCPLEIQE